MDSVGYYAKAIIAVVVAFGTSFATALDDGSVNTTEWLVAVGAAVVAFGGVYAANLTIKWLVGAATVLIGGLVTALESGDISPQEWATVLVATVVAIGSIWTAPNAAQSTERP
jgi:hypothetical protein